MPKALELYNTLTRQKEPFQPLTAQQVKLYVCGITVYDWCHLGHARTMMAFDVLYRTLIALGYETTYVRNITDVDDKILARAIENQEAPGALTARFIQAMHEDFAALGILPPTVEPRATQYIDKMVAFIERMIANGHAYRADNGDVFYRVRSFARYGQLSGRTLDALRAGERVEINPYKEDPLDFVLWKRVPTDAYGFESTLGWGRPGWHTECSVMAMDALGETLDIHGGGFDLPFPHHENEIAQSECVTHKTFARTWMHVGFITVKNDKMSKSLNNFLTIRDVLAQYPAEVIRFFLLASHYRSPLQYTDEALSQARAALGRLYGALRGLVIDRAVVAHQPVPASVEQAVDAFWAALCDDLNTPQALAALFNLATLVQRLPAQAPERSIAAYHLHHLGGVIGLLQGDADAFFQAEAGLDKAAIEALIEKRNQAKAAKDFATADAIRAQLQSQGVVLEDSASGTRWRKG